MLKKVDVPWSKMRELFAELWRALEEAAKEELATSPEANRPDEH